jgi:hypothetical protein
MDRFTTKYADHLAGTLSGFDRLVFRGSLRRLAYAQGMREYLSCHSVLLKDFGAFANALTQRLRQACEAAAQAQDVPVVYLPSPETSKEDTARRLAQERGITHGPICLLSTVELGSAYEVRANRATQRLELRRKRRPCLHYYRYEFHPVCGFLGARLQTWFPFDLQICLNGREWLAQQLEAAGVGYVRQDNCFLHVADFAQAQQLLEAQLRVCWPELLDGIARTLQPLHPEWFGEFRTEYYWTVQQSEWATDLVFQDPQQLRRLYPRLVQHGMTNLGSTDVLRFLGRKLGPGERLPGAFQGEVTSDLKGRVEGVRLKHRVKQNSVKLYDKAATAQRAVLRAETTLNQVAEFKVYRAKEGGPAEEKAWRPLRKSVADLHRRAEVSQAANERYLNALASADDRTLLGEPLQRVTVPTTWQGKRVRALQPFAPADMALLQAVSRGEFSVNGLPGALWAWDLRPLLYGPEDRLAPEEVRRRAGRVTRQLRLLRAHGVLRKVPGTHRYQLTEEGRALTTALLSARQTPVAELLARAA